MVTVKVIVIVFVRLATPFARSVFIDRLSSTSCFS
eukprot:COSAG01_NODE_55444_length_325_cov_0.601770_2_plen_34_part_01